MNKNITDEKIEKLADVLWNKWAIAHEGFVYMSKCLFTLAIQDKRLKAALNYSADGWKEDVECSAGKFEHNKSIFHLGQCHFCYSNKIL